MSLAKKLGKFILSLALIGNTCPTHCNSQELSLSISKTKITSTLSIEKRKVLKKELRNKKLALALIASYGYENATKGLEEIFKEDLSDLSDYDLHTARTKNFEEFFGNLEHYSTTHPIDALILVYHGSQNTLKINS